MDGNPEVEEMLEFLAKFDNPGLQTSNIVHKPELNVKSADEDDWKTFDLFDTSALLEVADILDKELFQKIPAEPQLEPSENKENQNPQNLGPPNSNPPELQYSNSNTVQQNAAPVPADGPLINPVLVSFPPLNSDPAPRPSNSQYLSNPVQQNPAPMSAAVPPTNPVLISFPPINTDPPPQSQYSNPVQQNPAPVPSSGPPINSVLVSFPPQISDPARNPPNYQYSANLIQQNPVPTSGPPLNQSQYQYSNLFLQNPVMVSSPQFNVVPVSGPLMNLVPALGPPQYPIQAPVQPLQQLPGLGAPQYQVQASQQRFSAPGWAQPQYSNQPYVYQSTSKDINFCNTNIQQTQPTYHQSKEPPAHPRVQFMQRVSIKKQIERQLRVQTASFKEQLNTQLPKGPGWRVVNHQDTSIAKKKEKIPRKKVLVKKKSQCHPNINWVAKVEEIVSEVKDEDDDDAFFEEFIVDESELIKEEAKKIPVKVETGKLQTPLQTFFSSYDPDDPDVPSPVPAPVQKEKKRNYVFVRQPCRCQKCGQKFSKPAYLKQHMSAKHSGYQHKCSSCGKSFPTELRLAEHWLVHTGGVHKLGCRVRGCSKSFVHSVDLTRHQKSHDNIRDYKCSVCFLDFIRQDQMVKHELIHFKIKK